MLKNLRQGDIAAPKIQSRYNANDIEFQGCFDDFRTSRDGWKG